MGTLPLGLRYPDGAPLFHALDEADVLTRLAGDATEVRRTAVAPWTFDERPPAVQPALDDPVASGWTFVVADGDPDRDSIVAAIERLAKHRKMAAPDTPLSFPGADGPGDWIDHTYRGLGDDRPRYVLLAGAPARLPYGLQVDLAAAGAIVGRLGFGGDDRLAALEAYVDKVIDLERAAGPATTDTAIVLATDGGPRDPTFYSRRYLAGPITKLLRDKGSFAVTELQGADATRARLAEATTTGKPAIVFTATHGAGQPRAGGLAGQQKANGAIGCAPEPGAGAGWDWLRADQLPAERFCHGGIVFQYGCFSAGTSTHSSYSRWLGGTDDYDADEPFVAALPQRLLADPDGPIAFVGHVDVAVLHGFDDPVHPIPTDGVHPRLQPFLTVIDRAAIDLTPVGYAVRDLHERAASMSSDIASTFDGMANAGITVADLDAAERATLIDKVIRRNDAMHFLLLGDPAARVRVDA